MKITLISVGKIKEKYFTNQIETHIKNIRKHVAVEVVEVADEKCPEKLSEKEMVQVKDKEGERILSKIPDQSYVIALAINGKPLPDMKRLLKTNQSVTLIIGGSLGLSDQVMKRAKTTLSFSKMTFPHQLMKVMLLEQIDQTIGES